MSYEDPRVVHIRERMPVWAGLYNRVAAGPAVRGDHPLGDEIIFEHPVASQPVGNVLRYLADETLQIHLALIQHQKALADAGIYRATKLREIFGFYVHDILEGDKKFAAADLEQQCKEVELMYQLNQSQLEIARGYADPEDAIFARYERLVEGQCAALSRFMDAEAADLNPEAGDSSSVMSWEEKERCLAKYESSTVAVASATISLCGKLGELIEAQARNMHYWHKALEFIASAGGGGGFQPTRDVDFEGHRFIGNLERCRIMFERGLKIYQLSGKVAERTFE